MKMTNDKKISKQMSFWLRHCPEDAGLELSEAGWTDVTALLSALGEKGIACDLKRLVEVVARNDKKRFEFSDDGQSIRARQGHSIEVDLGLLPMVPPDFLFHGTAERYLNSIMQDGLKPMNRHHVHLSGDPATAKMVGKRHGKPIVLNVAAGKMARNRHKFYCTANGVWLVDTVPPQFLSLVADTASI